MGVGDLPIDVRCTGSARAEAGIDEAGRQTLRRGKPADAEPVSPVSLSESE